MISVRRTVLGFIKGTSDKGGRIGIIVSKWRSRSEVYASFVTLTMNIGDGRGIWFLLHWGAFYLISSEQRTPPVQFLESVNNQTFRIERPDK